MSEQNCKVHGVPLIHVCEACESEDVDALDFESGRWWPVLLVMFGIVLLSFAQVAVDQWSSVTPRVAPADAAQVEGLTFYGNTVRETEPAPRAPGTIITLEYPPLKAQERDRWFSTRSRRMFVFEGGHWKVVP